MKKNIELIVGALVFLILIIFIYFTASSVDKESAQDRSVTISSK